MKNDDNDSTAARYFLTFAAVFQHQSHPHGDNTTGCALNTEKNYLKRQFFSKNVVFLHHKNAEP